MNCFRHEWRQFYKPKQFNNFQFIIFWKRFHFKFCCFIKIFVSFRNKTFYPNWYNRGREKNLSPISESPFQFSTLMQIFITRKFPSVTIWIFVKLIDCSFKNKELQTKNLCFLWFLIHLIVLSNLPRFCDISINRSSIFLSFLSFHIIIYVKFQVPWYRIWSITRKR